MLNSDYTTVKQGFMGLPIVIGIIAVLIVTIFLLFSKHDIRQVSPVSFIHPTPTPTSDALKGNSGAWLWESPYKLSEQETNSLLTFAEQQKITTIYVSIDDYVDLYELQDDVQKQKEIESFNVHTKEFIKQANLHNIHVQALAGETFWANSSHDYIPPLLLKYVFNFNKEQSKDGYGFDGMQFDIEFYNQPEFKDDSQTHARDYLKLVDNLTATVNSELENTANKKFQLGFAVPAWLGNEDSQVAPINWNDQTKPVGFHLIDILAKNTNSYIVLMSYRDKTDGPGGSIAISQPMIHYLDSTDTHVSAFVGIETSDTDEKSITYFGKTKKDVIAAANQIISAFSNSKHFQGIAIHHLISFKELEK